MDIPWSSKNQRCESLFEVILILSFSLCKDRRLSYCWRSDLAKSKQIAKVLTAKLYRFRYRKIILPKRWFILI